jgi:hypothetical protein
LVKTFEAGYEAGALQQFTICPGWSGSAIV